MIFDKKLAAISLAQILILVLATFSFSYIIYSSSSVSAQTADEDYTGNLGPSTGDYASANRVSVDFTRSSAAGLSCCVKMSNGAVCQEGVAEGNEAACPTGWIRETKCDQVSECKVGCCVDNSNGVCSPQSPRGLCSSSGGDWNANAICNVAQCQRNCCVLGDQTAYVTDGECSRLAESRGIDKKFVGVASENACLLMGGLQKKGACVYEQGGSEGERLCKFGTKEECNRIRGVFSENLICSNAELNTTCQKQSRTSCVENLDGVYWMDSCGNRENIWEGNSPNQKDSSWNGGIIKTPAESCDPSIADCGNCDRVSGSVCSMSTGKAMCKSLNCPAAPASVGTKSRINGESWCVYESKIGGGKDVPGSQQYVYSCIDGEVTSEACGDYRTGLCNENIVNGEGRDFSQAICKPNHAVECLSYNSAKNPQGKVKKCNENPDCSLKKFDFGKGYKFSVCLPKDPVGFDTTSKEELKKDKTICKQANFECVKVLEKKISGWDCVSGCDCDTVEFTNKMTDWCVSLGDCGPSANTEGKFTSKGYKISNAPKISQSKVSELKSNAQPRKDAFIRLDENYSINLLEKYYGTDSSGASLNDGGMGFLTKLGAGFGATGLLAQGTLLAAGVSDITIAFKGAEMGVSLAGVASIAGWTAIGMTVGIIVAKVLGLSGQATTIMALTGGLAGAFVGVGVTGAFTGTALAAAPLLGIPVFGWIAFAVIVLIAGALKALGIGDSKEIHVKYQCKPWQAPKGGEDCAKCGDNPLQPCTPYKCSTLGAACEYVNEGTLNAACINVAPNDNTVPVITPLNDVLTSGYKYEIVNNQKIRLTSSSGECIPEFTPVVTGLKTDENAQCVFSSKPGVNFEDADEDFNEEESYTLNHTLTITMPSAESIAYEMMRTLQDNKSVSIAILEQKINEQYNDINFYVRCEDRAGNANPTDYIINTCVKPLEDISSPALTKAIPTSGSNIAYNQNESEVMFYLNEPAECKWSLTAEKNYSSMENSMSCITGILDVGPFGWSCNTTLTGINNSDRNFYVRCIDKPWLKGTGEENERNPSTRDIVYSIKATKNPLTIKEITPSTGSTIYGGAEPFTITLHAETSGGVESGKAQCSYSFIANDDNPIEFYNTLSDTHSNTWNLMTRGNKTIYVECKDIAGNTATSSTSFNLELDTRAPVVTRAFNIQGGLTIVTDEDSECAYSKNSCDFLFNGENSTRMLGIGRTHTSTEFGEESTYYVRCVDKYNNPALGCSIILKAY